MAYSEFSPAHVAPYLTAGALATTLSLWPVIFPALALILLVVSLVTGQLLRLPLPGQGGGLLLSDIAVVLVLVAALMHAIRAQHYSLSSLPVTRLPREALAKWGSSLLFLPFLLWSAFTLAINAPAYSVAELAISFAYWLRLAAYLLLVPALLSLTRGPHRRLLRRGFIAGTAVLVAAGLLQRLFITDLTILQSGWDPHPGRLVSTWLDPNFFGAFLLLAAIYLLQGSPLPQGEGRGLPAGQAGVRALFRRVNHYFDIWHLSFGIFIIIALLLTESRSTLLAAAITAALLLPLIVISWLKQPTTARIVIACAVADLLLLAGILGGLMLGERALGLIQPDATVQLRAEALTAAWPLALDNSLVGVGYNAYQFAARDAGLISDFSMHSRAGADMSLLTLWVTTGLLGIVLFLLPWCVYITKQLTQWLKSRETYLLVGPAAVTALGIHSLFVNSALYPHLLVTLAIIIALTSKPVIAPVGRSLGEDWRPAQAGRGNPSR